MASRNQPRNNTRRLFREQGGECFYCHTEMYLLENSTKQYRKVNRNKLATFDHIKLKSDGGTYAKHNGVCACFKCNGIRGNLPQDVFIDNFDFIVAEWEKGNRSAYIQNGKLLTISSKKLKRMKKMEKKKQRNSKNLATAGFIIARYAEQIGKTVEDLFLEFVYNSTYEQVRDL